VSRRTKNKKGFRAVTAVKALARERIGAPPSARVVPDRKKKERDKEKHKRTLSKMLQAED
jgi:hypothetical protein